MYIFGYFVSFNVFRKLKGRESSILFEGNVKINVFLYFYINANFNLSLYALRIAVSFTCSKSKGHNCIFEIVLFYFFGSEYFF